MVLSVNDTLRMYKSDDIRMYNFDCITDTIVEVITTCNTYTLLTKEDERIYHELIGHQMTTEEKKLLMLGGGWI